MTTHTEGLKPCPWCLSTNVATQPDDQQGTKWGYAYCADCGIRGPEVRTSYKLADDAPWRSEAIAAWNTRPAQASEAAIRNAALEELLDQYWQLAYKEGQEGRSHDTQNGDAQRVLSAIRALSTTPAEPAPAHIPGATDDLLEMVKKYGVLRYRMGCTSPLSSGGLYAEGEAVLDQIGKALATIQPKE